MIFGEARRHWFPPGESVPAIPAAANTNGFYVLCPDELYHVMYTAPYSP